MAFLAGLITFLIRLFFCRFLWLTEMLLVFGDTGSTVMQAGYADGWTEGGWKEEWMYRGWMEGGVDGRRVDGRRSGWLEGGWKEEWMVGGWMDGGLNALMNGCMDEWVSGWNGWLNVWLVGCVRL